MNGKKGKSKHEKRTPRKPTEVDLKYPFLDNCDLYLNREIEWLCFNERVLGEAEDRTNPLLERLKFVIIFNTNLDEFFMVRLSALLRLLEKEGQSDNSIVADAQTPEETFDDVSKKVRALLKRASSCLKSDILPKLAEKAIVVASIQELERSEEDFIADFFDELVFPVLTPLAVDPAHPFPYLTNLSLYLAVHFEEVGVNGEPLLAFVEIPRALDRLITITNRDRKYKCVLLEDVVKKHLHKLFPWTKVASAYLFRVTRNQDYQLYEGDVKDLMKSIELELKDRAQKIAVRLEVEAGIPAFLKNRLRIALQLDAADVYEVSGLFNLRDASALLRLDVDPFLRDPPFSPRTHPRLRDERDIFSLIREKEILLHHPYDSFGAVLEFLRQAADDPNVLAIKQTLYRAGGDSPIIGILIRAAENGKQVSVVVELKARFDEQNNIEWAKRLERAGVHVVFGFVGLKTHAKSLLVIRRENGRLQRYVHLSTGNYNSTTAKIYTDIGMLTADNALTGDVVNLFNLLTGFNVLRGEDKPERFAYTPQFEKICLAPFTLRDFFLKNIEREIAAGKNGHIILKMNALVDQLLIRALYKASCEGVRIELIIRGMCSLRPGIKGISENIRVVSIVDRFLEHSRIYWFHNEGNALVLLGSADFMPRNMDRRIECVWPVESRDLKESIWDILQISLRDNVKNHEKLSDGSYEKKTAGSASFRSQEKFVEIAQASVNPQTMSVVETRLGTALSAGDGKYVLRDDGGASSHNHKPSGIFEDITGVVANSIGDELDDGQTDK